MYFHCILMSGIHKYCGKHQFSKIFTETYKTEVKYVGLYFYDIVILNFPSVSEKQNSVLKGTRIIKTKLLILFETFQSI